MYLCKVHRHYKFHHGARPRCIPFLVSHLQKTPRGVRKSDVPRGHSLRNSRACVRGGSALRTHGNFENWEKQQAAAPMRIIIFPVHEVAAKNDFLFPGFAFDARIATHPLHLLCGAQDQQNPSHQLLPRIPQRLFSLRRSALDLWTPQGPSWAAR